MMQLFELINLAYVNSQIIQLFISMLLFIIAIKKIFAWVQSTEFKKISIFAARLWNYMAEVCSNAFEYAYEFKFPLLDKLCNRYLIFFFSFGAFLMLALAASVGIAIFTGGVTPQKILYAALFVLSCLVATKFFIAQATQEHAKMHKF